MVVGSLRPPARIETNDSNPAARVFSISLVAAAEFERSLIGEHVGKPPPSPPGGPLPGPCTALDGVFEPSLISRICHGISLLELTLGVLALVGGGNASLNRNSEH